jgi:hypothetical protein
MINFVVMLAMEDDRWTGLCGGYRIPFDARPLLRKLSAGEDDAATWSVLWDELHHQGDVGEASYVAIPHLVNIYRRRGVLDWNIYAIVAIIELARDEGANPAVPDWLRKAYFDAIEELARIGSIEILQADDSETVRAILGILAISKSLRTYGRFLLSYSEDEMLEMETRSQKP